MAVNYVISETCRYLYSTEDQREANNNRCDYREYGYRFILYGSWFDAIISKYTLKPVITYSYNRALTMSMVEIMLIMIPFHDSGYCCLRHFYLTWVRRIQNKASCVSRVLVTLIHGFFGKWQYADIALNSWRWNYQSSGVFNNTPENLFLIEILQTTVTRVMEKYHYEHDFCLWHGWGTVIWAFHDRF